MSCQARWKPASVLAGKAATRSATPTTAARLFGESALCRENISSSELLVCNRSPSTDNQRL